MKLTEIILVVAVKPPGSDVSTWLIRASDGYDLELQDAIVWVTRGAAVCGYPIAQVARMTTPAQYTEAQVATTVDPARQCIICHMPLSNAIPPKQQTCSRACGARWRAGKLPVE